jgi:transposase
MDGHRKRILEPHRGFIAERLEQNPHLTLHGLKAELASRGIIVSHNTIWEFIRSEGLGFKSRAAMHRSSYTGLFQEHRSEFTSAASAAGWCLRLG